MRAFNSLSISRSIVSGKCGMSRKLSVMRLAMVSLWLRAAASDVAGRRCAIRYAIGITVVQIGWVVRLVAGNTSAIVAFVVLAAEPLFLLVDTAVVGHLGRVALAGLGAGDGATGGIEHQHPVARPGPGRAVLVAVAGHGPHAVR